MDPRVGAMMSLIPGGYAWSGNKTFINWKGFTVLMEGGMEPVQGFKFVV